LALGLVRDAVVFGALYDQGHACMCACGAPKGGLSQSAGLHQTVVTVWSCVVCATCMLGAVPALVAAIGAAVQVHVRVHMCLCACVFVLACVCIGPLPCCGPSCGPPGRASNAIASVLPSWLHPNAITIAVNAQFIGLAVAVAVGHAPEGGSQATPGPLPSTAPGAGLAHPAWLGALGLSCLLREYGDWVDGTHARNTGQCTVVGSLLDHAADCVSLPLTFLAMQLALGVDAASTLLPATALATLLGLFFTHWHSYLSGALHPDELSHILMGWVTPALFLGCGLWGSHVTHVAGLVAAGGILLGGAATVAGIVAQCVRLPRSAWRAGADRSAWWTEAGLWLAVHVAVLYAAMCALDGVAVDDGPGRARVMMLALLTDVFVNGLVCNHMLVATMTGCGRVLALGPCFRWLAFAMAPPVLLASGRPLAGLVAAGVLWSADFALHAVGVHAACG
jgi:phosphatidylglycerophosphate synthase